MPDTQHSTNIIGTIRSNITGMRFSLGELSGSLGDMGIFMPLTLGMVQTCGMDLGIVLVFAGLANIAAGVVFGLPIPIQPMKAIAAVAIADQLLPAEIAAAGIVVGAATLLVGVTGWVEKFGRLVPLPVVRGIQLGVGIKLAWKGAESVANKPLAGLDSILVAVVAAVAVFATWRWRSIPWALALCVYGAVVVALTWPGAITWPQLSFPSFTPIVGGYQDWLNGLLYGAVIQWPLTLLNSVLAICVLSGDLFPSRQVPYRKMAISVGMINLLPCWFGAMPTCHGSGGLAAHYRFGARTGGAMVILGVGELILGLLFGAALMRTLIYFPYSILGVLLFLSGLELARPARDQREAIPILIVLVTAAGILIVNTLVGFLAGMAIAGATALFKGRRRTREID